MKFNFSFFMVLLLMTGCDQPQGFVEPEDPLDAGREFVRATLDGNFEKAALYVNDDIEDQDLYVRYENFMKRQPKAIKLQFKSASIIINTVRNESDSVTIMNYSNSYTNKPTALKILKHDSKWRVDLSYTFSGNTLLEK